MNSPLDAIRDLTRLEFAFFATFDLDARILEPLCLKVGAEKMLVVRGEGEYVESALPELSAATMLVRYDPTDTILPSGGYLPSAYHHIKMRLFLYQDEQGRRQAELTLGSQNIFPYENIEGSCVFLGEEAQTKQVQNEPLCAYLSVLLPFASKKQQDQIKRLLDVLPYLCFAPSEHQFAFKDFSFLLPSCKDAPFLQEPYDELLIVTPFVQSEPLLDLYRRQKEGGRTLVYTHVESALPLLKSEEELPDFLILEDAPYLHAKIYLVKHESIYDLYIGSMNLSLYSIFRNDEALVRLHDVQGIESLEGFLSSYFGFSIEQIKEGVFALRKDAAQGELFDCARQPSSRIGYLRHLIKQNRYEGEELLNVARFLLGRKSDLVLRRFWQGEEVIPLRSERIVHEKKRLIHALPLEEKATLGLLNYVLHRYDDRFSRRVYLHLEGRGGNDVFYAIRNFPSFRNLHLYRSDIHAFDPSMDPFILKRCIEETYPDDKQARDFLTRFVTSRAYRLEEGGEVYHNGDAVRSGLPLCGLLENLYLRDLDFLLEQGSDFYARVGDDILFGCFNEESLHGLIEVMKKTVEAKKLTLSARKTHICAPGEAVDYLGLSLQGGTIDFSPSFLEELARSLRGQTKRFFAYFAAHHIPPSLRLPSLVRYANKRLGDEYFQHYFKFISRDAGFRQIDAMVIDMIRRLASGKAGKGRFRITYQHLKLFGYSSLVSRYYAYINRNKKDRK